jgi:hypothetical protein
MQLTTLKTTVLSIPGITADWVKSEFGDLRLKATWQAALDRCSEFIAAAVDAAPVVIEQVTEAVQTAYAVFAPIAWGILWLCCLTFHAVQAIAAWWHSAPAQATDPIFERYHAADRLLVKYQDERLSGVVTIG